MSEGAPAKFIFHFSDPVLTVQKVSQTIALLLEMIVA